jgi:hypothetical protein
MRKFGNDQIAQLYPKKEDYLAAVERAIDKVKSEGYLLAADADAIRQEARSFSIPAWQ